MRTDSAGLHPVSSVSSPSVEDDFLGRLVWFGLVLVLGLTWGTRFRVTILTDSPCGALDMIQLGFSRGIPSLDPPYLSRSKSCSAITEKTCKKNLLFL